MEGVVMISIVLVDHPDRTDIMSFTDGGLRDGMIEPEKARLESLLHEASLLVRQVLSREALSSPAQLVA
jgi:hypothetical protein